MSKKHEDGTVPSMETPAEIPAETPAENGAGSVPIFRAVEEHAAEMGLSAPVFAAVKQARGWAAGKKVEKTVFEEAVNGFLNAPMGGK